METAEVHGQVGTVERRRRRELVGADGNLSAQSGTCRRSGTSAATTGTCRPRRRGLVGADGTLKLHEPMFLGGYGEGKKREKNGSDVDERPAAT